MDYIEFVKEYRNLACRYADAAIRLQEPANQAMTGGSSSRTPITPGRGGDKLQAEIQAVNASGIRQDTYRLPVIFFQSSGYQLH